MRPIDISTSSIIRIFLIILGIYFLYLIRDVLALLFISIVLVSAIDPAVDWLHRKKIPRSFGVLLIYLVLFFLVGILIYFLIPPIQAQFSDFSSNFPTYAEKLNAPFENVKNAFETSHIEFSSERFSQRLGESISDFSGSIFSRTFGIFSGFVFLIAILSLTFYMAAVEDGFGKFLRMVLPVKHQEYALSLMERIKQKIGKWMQGQLVLMFLVFLLDYVGLSLIGVPYALVLAIFAGIMEIIPYVGPIISAIPGIFLGFMISPWVGFLTLLMYVLVQQFENHIITPQVMKKAVGLNPIVVILALFIGAKIGGALGAILAIPAATAINVFVGDILKKE
ncbi:MAG: AI-2E family transporter [Patescibacteria group bacterium]